MGLDPGDPFVAWLSHKAKPLYGIDNRHFGRPHKSLPADQNGSSVTEMTWSARGSCNRRTKSGDAHCFVRQPLANPIARRHAGGTMKGIVRTASVGRTSLGESGRPVRVGARGLPVDSGQSGLECGGTTLWSVPAIATQRSSENACLKACGVRLFDRAPWLHGHRRHT